jgi:hypothetical protein
MQPEGADSTLLVLLACVAVLFVGAAAARLTGNRRTIRLDAPALG